MIEAVLTYSDWLVLIITHWVALAVGFFIGAIVVAREVW